MTDGVEISYATDGKIILDLESEKFYHWRETMKQMRMQMRSTHYAEYIDLDTGEKYWTVYPNQPGFKQMYVANNIVRKNEDGSYEYVKNRHDGNLRKLTDEEVVWLLLKVGG